MPSLYISVQTYRQESAIRKKGSRSGPPVAPDRASGGAQGSILAPFRASAGPRQAHFRDKDRQGSHSGTRNGPSMGHLRVFVSAQVSRGRGSAAPAAVHSIIPDVSGHNVATSDHNVAAFGLHFFLGRRAAHAMRVRRHAPKRKERRGRVAMHWPLRPVLARGPSSRFSRVPKDPVSEAWEGALRTRNNRGWRVRRPPPDPWFAKDGI